MRDAVLVAALCAVAAVARANPLSLARFGGLGGDAVYTGAFALYWNPAALAREGWDAGLDLSLVARQASYFRDPDYNHVPDAAEAANAGLATIHTFGAVPSVFGRWGTRLGAFDVGAGAGVFVENGGSASWDKNLGAPPQYPGAVDGPQRWASISAQLLMVDLGVGFALRHRRTGWSLGFAPLLVVSRFSTVRARDIDQSEDVVDAMGNPKEGRAFFDGSGVAFSAIVGARWEHPAGWAIAATYQRGARTTLRGQLRVAFATQAPSSQEAMLELPIADTVRVAAALPLRRWLTLRPQFEWANWSVVRQHVFAAVDGTPLLVIPRDMRDLFGVKVRGEARVSPRWTVLAGAGFERGPTPAHTMEPGFGEHHDIEAGVGARVAVSHRVDLAATFLYQWFVPFEVRDSVQQPTTNGTYEDQREWLTLDVEVHQWRPWQ